MTIDTNTMISISEANQNFSKDARLVDEDSIASDEDVLSLSKKIMKQNKEAYEVLAK